MLHRIWILSFALAGCFGPPDAMEGEQLLKDIDAHIGKRVVVKAKFKSGARLVTEFVVTPTAPAAEAGHAHHMP